MRNRACYGFEDGNSANKFDSHCVMPQRSDRYGSDNGGESGNDERDE